MDSLLALQKWAIKNRDVGFDLVRIYLGIGLFLKGLNFIFNQTQAAEFLAPGNLPFFPFFWIHIVTLIHICGGLFMAAGLLTRLAALIQIPPVFAAVYYIHLQHGLFTMEQTLEFSLLVLFLLALCTIYGGGRLSVDFYLGRYFERRRRKND